VEFSWILTDLVIGLLHMQTIEKRIHHRSYRYVDKLFQKDYCIAGTVALAKTTVSNLSRESTYDFCVIVDLDINVSFSVSYSLCNHAWCVCV